MGSGQPKRKFCGGYLMGSPGVSTFMQKKSKNPHEPEKLMCQQWFMLGNWIKLMES